MYTKECRCAKPREVLLDVCASSRSMRAALTDSEHDVLSALEKNPSATDEDILALAFEEQRVLVTEDKDFGELVSVRRLPHPCIIRFVDMPVIEKVAAMRELIEHYAEAMQEGALIVVTQNRVRVRHVERG